MTTSINLLLTEAARSVLSPMTNGKASNYVRPTIAALYLTKFCNSRCTMCDFWKFDKDPNELTSEQWGVVFSRLKFFGVDYIGVNASGELFTRRDIFEILGHLRDLDISFGVNTNATLLTARKSKQLAALRPSAITIGLDGVGDASYMVTRGLKNGFTKISRHIDNLQSAGITNIGIGSVLMPDNIYEWVNLCNFVIEKGLSSIRFTAYHENYFNEPDPNRKTGSQDESFIAMAEREIEKLIEIKRRTGIIKNSEEYLKSVSAFYKNPSEYFPHPCLQGSNRIEVDIYGNVTLCSFMTDPLGNLVKQDMEEIWQSEKHRDARAAAYQGKCPKCFLSCYAEENIRLSTTGFLPTLSDSLSRGIRILGQK